MIIVGAVASRPSGPGPAIAGAAAATGAVLITGAWLRGPLTRIPETELKYGVGILLTAFGVFFAGEGLDVAWPGGDAALPVIVVVLLAFTQFLIRRGRPRAALAT